MNDPRLNSVHLESPRRQEYRRARADVLGARGCDTLAGEQRDRFARSPTALEQAPGSAPEHLQLWLVDCDYLYPLHVGLNTLGRASDNDIVIHDGYISRRHCVVLVHSSRRVELFDTASKNGIFVNGEKLRGSASLKPGDEIRMCDRQLVFMARPGDSSSHRCDTLAG